MKMLIPLDGSRFAEEVLGPAAELAARTDAEVYLIEVVKESKVHATWAKLPSTERGFGTRYAVSGVRLPYTCVSAVETGILAETKDQAWERAHHVAEDYLEHVASRYFPSGCHKEVVIGEDPADAISDYARSQKIDLIAMATHGRTGLAWLLMGSVAARLLKTHVAPLFLLRPDKLNEDYQEEGLSAPSHVGDRNSEDRWAA